MDSQNYTGRGSCPSDLNGLRLALPVNPVFVSTSLLDLL
jgi:hypothetical protein